MLGNNMFAYCLNNPVNMVDSKGSFPTWKEIEEGINKAIDWMDDNIVQPVEEFIEDVTEDFENLDSDNQSEDVVFSSNFFSFYNGVLVVKTPFDASFSFGIIGLSTRQQTADVLNHEYGHSLQLEEMGTAMYVINVAIPSVIINLLDRQGKLPYDYYSYPWEAGANELGKSLLSQSKKPKLPQDADVSIWQLLRDLLG